MLDIILFFTAVVGRVHVAGRVSGVAADNITFNATYDNVTHLINSMLKSYDIRLRPNFGERPLVLDLDIAVASFDSVSEVNMDFTMTMYLYQYWKDERLAWLPNHRNESITLGGDFSQKIWVPDTFLANDKSSYLHDVTEVNKMLKLYSDGYIAYGMRFTSTLACKMDLRSFPLDRQNFSIEIESYGYTTDDLYMQWRNGRQSIRGIMDSEMPQFRILNYEALNRLERTDTGAYQRLSLVLILRRSVGYYMFQTYFPSTLIVALSWISFWINHEATAARVALGVTTVLTMTTISTGVRASLPRISYIKAIDIYLVMCFVFVFAALLEYAAVNYTYWGSTRMNKRARRRRSDAAVEPMYDGRRQMTAMSTQVKEFPTWDMYVKNEEDVTDVMELCRHRRRSQIVSGDREGAGDEYEMQVRNSRIDEGTDEEEAEDVLAADYGHPMDSGDSTGLTHLGPRAYTGGRVSPIPGLLQQLRRQPIPDSCGASSSACILEEPGEAANWTALMSTDEFPRPPSPPVVLHTSSALRRRPPSATSVSSRSPYEQQLLTYAEGDSGQKSRRRTHPLQGHKRRAVSFSVWRNKGITSAPGSVTSASRFQSRNYSLSRREFVTSLRRKARAVRAVLPRIHDVNVIDKWSRAMFPLSFVLFNFVYWCYYIFSDWKD